MSWLQLGSLEVVPLSAVICSHMRPAVAFVFGHVDPSLVFGQLPLAFSTAVTGIGSASSSFKLERKLLMTNSLPIRDNVARYVCVYLTLRYFCEGVSIL